jgi:hypothetical protein
MGVAGVAVGAPAVLAQAIPKTLLRMCLRNVVTGIACYVVGRGGELIVDGSLSAAWAKARETVGGETPEHHDKPADKTSPRPTGAVAALPQLSNPIIEPIKPSDLGPLSRRLPGSPANKTLTEGFLIYDGPLGAARGTHTPLPIAPPPPPATPKYAKPRPGSDAHRAREVRKPMPPATPPTAGQLATLRSRTVFSPSQLECQKRRERETGLSLGAIMSAPDFDTKLRRRLDEIVKPCISAR